MRSTRGNRSRSTGHTAWRVKDGFFSSAPGALTQTADGYIWIGTQAGVMRFDGVRFVPWAPPGDQALPSQFVTTLLGARDGSLWIGTTAGLSRWANGVLTTYASTSGTIITIVEDRDGTTWFLRVRFTDAGGALCQVVAERVRCFGPADGIDEHSPMALRIAPSGSLWIGGASTLFHGRPGAFSTYRPKALVGNANMVGVGDIAVTSDDDVWLGIGLPGEGGGLQRLRRGALSPVMTPQLNGPSLTVSGMLRDRDGALWLGTESEGVYRLHGDTAHRFRAADGLTGEHIIQFYEDREGSIWVVTSAGVDHFRDLRVASYSLREGLSSGEIDGVLASRDGSVWVATSGALDVLRNDRVSSIRAGKGLPGNQVTSLFEDRDGQLWVGVDQGLYAYAAGRFSPVNQPDGRPVGLVVGMTDDIDGNLWVEVTGAPRKLYRIRDGTVRDVFPEPAMPAARRVAGAPDGGIWLGLLNGDLARWRRGALEIFVYKPDPAPRESTVFNQLLVEPDGTVLGATAFGLIGWREGVRRTLTVRNGLPCDRLFALVTDSEGDLWLSSACGLVEISRASLQKWWAAPEVLVEVRVLDVFDGAQAATVPFEGAARSVDGRLWFASGFTLQMVDPSRLQGNPLPPPVAIEEIVADRVSYAAEGGLRLPPRTRDLQISYTALSFVAPRKVRFRYQLEGHDADWVDPGTRRQAFYSDLRPGDYRFRVIAANEDGVWNQSGAMLSLTVAPAWYQTRWFQASSAVAAVALIWIGFRIRVRHIAATLGAEFDGRLRERMRLARDLHDTLLQTVSASKMMLDANLVDLADPEQRRTARRVSDWLGQAMKEGRAALNSLHMSTVREPGRLAETLRKAAEALVADDAISTVLRVDGDVQNVHPIVAEEVVFIGREAMWNALKHSNGTRLEIDLCYATDLTLRVRDNGKGLAPDVIDQARPGHFGIRSMQERAAIIGATFRLASSGAGTEVTLVVPGTVVFGRQGRRALRPRLS